MSKSKSAPPVGELAATVKTTIEKLHPFADLVGKVPAEKLAEMAGVPVAVVASIEEVAAARVGDDPAAVEKAGLAFAAALGVPASQVDEVRALVGELVRKEQVDTLEKLMEPEITADSASSPDQIKRAIDEAIAGSNFQRLPPAPADAPPAAPSGEKPADAPPAPSGDAPPADPADPPAGTSAPDTMPPEIDPVPPSVRVVVSGARVVREGKPFKVHFRDVFSGAKAAWLWAHHRDLVEVYPAAGRS